MKITAKNVVSISDLSDGDIDLLLKTAELGKFDHDALRGKWLINFFFEESTRTRMSFEIAAKSMGAHVVNIQSSSSAVAKGEDFRTSIDTVLQYDPDYIVVRHNESGIFNLLSGMKVAGLINAGDGKREHPTQALGDVLTIMQRKGRVEGLVVAICGDVKRNRVCGSNLALLKRMGADVRLVTSPHSVLTGDMTGGVPVFYDMADGVRSADVVMVMRHKREYNDGPDESKFYAPYKISYENLRTAKDNVIVMHPGPVMKGVDFDDDVYENTSVSAVRDQVCNCLLMRKSMLLLM